MLTPFYISSDTHDAEEEVSTGDMNLYSGDLKWDMTVPVEMKTLWV